MNHSTLNKLTLNWLPLNRLWLLPIGVIALALPAAVLAGGGEGGFNGVVHSIEGRYHVHATRIPFLGLISFVSKKATHAALPTCTWPKLILHRRGRRQRTQQDCRREAWRGLGAYGARDQQIRP